MLIRLGLNGFKSFKTAKVDLAPLTVLIGTNGSGKSNLLDALRFMQGLAMDLPVLDVLRGRWEGGRLVWPGIRGGPTDLVHKADSNALIGCSWKTDDHQLVHIVMVEGAEHPELQAEHVFHPQGKVLFDIPEFDHGFKGSMQVKLASTTPGTFITQTAASNRSALHQISTAPPVAPEVGPARDFIVRTLRGALFLDIQPTRMRGWAPRGLDSLGLEGENVSAVTWQMCQDPEARRALVDWLTELCAPELEDIDFAKTDLGDVMLVFVEKGGRRIPARSLSDGTLRFLGTLMALRTAPEGTLLLLEEIENGLHPTRMHLLVEAMEAATRDRGIQIIATTHSPMVLNALSEQALRDAVLVARPPGSDGSVLRRLGDLPGFDEVRARRGVDRMLVSGWLENAL